MSYLLGVDDDPRLPPPGMRRKAEIDMAFAPNHDARAGVGSVNDPVAVEAYPPIPHWMLEKLAAPGAKARFMRAAGDRLELTFGAAARNALARPYF